MKNYPKILPQLATALLMAVCGLLPTSCKEEDGSDPKLPILFVQVVLEENGQDLFELDSYKLDSINVYGLVQNERFDLLLYYKYDADTAAFIGLPYLQNSTVYIFDYGNGDTDTLEWNVLNDPGGGAEDDLYGIYFNGVLNHEIQMSWELLNNMGLPFDKNSSKNNNIIYPVTKK